MRRIFLTSGILAILGTGLSGYALWQHYAPLGSAICNVSEIISCDIVNKSSFSEIGNVPVAAVGLAGYLVMALLIFWAWRAEQHRRRLVAILGILAVTGLFFSLYLTYIELFVIGAICPLCVGSQITIALLTIITYFLWPRTK